MLRTLQKTVTIKQRIHVCICIYENIDLHLSILLKIGSIIPLAPLTHSLPLPLSSQFWDCHIFTYLLVSFSHGNCLWLLVTYNTSEQTRGLEEFLGSEFGVNWGLRIWPGSSTVCSIMSSKLCFRMAPAAKLNSMHWLNCRKHALAVLGFEYSNYLIVFAGLLFLNKTN